MAISFPLTLLDTFPGWSTEFELSYRQEQSRVAGGRTYVKDFGSPLWRAVFQSRSLSPNEMDEWRARLEALDGGLQTFRAWSMSRAYPIAYPKGKWPTGSSFSGSGTVSAINANRKAITPAGFPTGFVFSVGDLVQIGNADLHRVMEKSTGAAFEVRPHIWPGVTTGAALKVLKPSCLMTIVPGTISSAVEFSTGKGALSFEGIEAR